MRKISTSLWNHLLNDKKYKKKVMVLVQYCRIISAIGAVTPIPYILVIDSTLTCKKIWPETPSEFHSVGPKGYGSMELEHFQILLDELWTPQWLWSSFYSKTSGANLEGEVEAHDRAGWWPCALQHIELAAHLVLDVDLPRSRGYDWHIFALPASR